MFRHPLLWLAARERNTRSLLGLMQFAINVRGVASEGREWSGDGEHWNGRKGPMFFTGLMLADEGLVLRVEATDFSVDRQIYHGRGSSWTTALSQVVYLLCSPASLLRTASRRQDPCRHAGEELPHRRLDGIPDTTPYARTKGAQELWNQDVCSDYCGNRMSTGDPYATARNNVTSPVVEKEGTDHDFCVERDAVRLSRPGILGEWRARSSQVNVVGGQSGAFVKNQSVSSSV